MKLRVTRNALAAAVLAPALAVASPADAAGTKSMSDAVAATACANAQRNGRSCTDDQFKKQMEAMQAHAQTIFTANTGLPANWMTLQKDLYRASTTVGGNLAGQAVVRVLGWLGRNNTDGKYPACVGTFCGGGAGGGGATGTWDDASADPCADYKFYLDKHGYFIVPTLNLDSGREINPNATPFWTITVNAIMHGGSSPAASMKWFTHKENAGKLKERWAAPYAGKPWHVDGTANRTISYSSSSMPYWNGSAYVLGGVSQGIPYGGGNAGPVTPGCTNADIGSTANCKTCPDGTTGGAFDYYISPKFICVMYAPNPSVGKGGYYYPETVGIPFSTAATLSTQSDSTLACEIDLEVIRAMTDALWRAAAAKPGYAGPAPTPVTAEDVRNGGEQPRIEELKAPVALPTSVPAATPTATPTPSTDGPKPTPTASSSPATPTYDPTVNNPELQAPEIDWWPDLPTITVDLGNPACPTYPLNVPAPFNWQLTLEAHCPLIEDNRATIAAIMLLLFTVGAVLVVLRA